MEKYDLDALCSLSLCDSLMKDIEIKEDIYIIFSNAALHRVEFHHACLEELRIKGYEVLDENEEVLFDMPDVEIFGDKIPEALENLMANEPHAVGFSKGENDSAVLTVTDNTDMYELQIRFSDAFGD